MDNGTAIEALKLKRIRVRNEISFIRSQYACGGAENIDELSALRKELDLLTKEIECLANQ